MSGQLLKQQEGTGRMSQKFYVTKGKGRLGVWEVLGLLVGSQVTGHGFMNDIRWFSFANANY